MLKREKNSFYRYMFWRSFMPLLSILAVISMLLVILYYVSVSFAAADRKENNSRRLQTCVSSVELNLQQIERWGKEIIGGTKFQHFVYMYEDLDWYSRYSLQQEIHNSLYELYSRNEQISSVVLYIPNMNKAISGSHCQISVKPWMEELSEGEDRTCMLADGREVTCIHWNGDEVNAVLIIEWNAAGIMKSIQSIFLSGGDEIEWVWKEKDYTRNDNCIYADSYYYPFRMIYKDNAADEMGQFIILIGGFSIAFMLLCLIIVVLSMHIWYRKVYHPLHILLIDAFDHMEKNDFGYRIESEDESEPFYLIYEKYNHMAETMQHYIEINLKQQILVSQSNLKQLQSQISPHFMYNSYYVLYRLIRRRDHENSLLLAEYLGNFYHYITRNADDEKRLFEEFEHARNYAAIQKYRFRDNLDITIPDPDSCISDVYVPRLILQPILENAFKYAYESGNGEPMKLEISYEIESSSNFNIIIENSGELLPETLQMIRKRLNSSDPNMESTAIINIDRRLKIYFGKESGLTVDKSKLGGLKVIMHIEKKEEH